MVNGDQSVELVTEMQRDDLLGHVRKLLHYVNNGKGRKTSELEHELHKAMVEPFMANILVVDVYSPPRVANMARSMGMRAGWSGTPMGWEWGIEP